MQTPAGRSLVGKRIIVIGGTSGIGEGAVHAFASEGADVVLMGTQPSVVRESRSTRGDAPRVA
jgi:NAD(P)-dependent dehydrogenase (short-subunit alcohol dehydrogenase family)